MTKAAIAHLTKCLAVEWGVHGITVTGVNGRPRSFASWHGGRSQ